MINRIDTKSVKIIRLVSGEEICCRFPLHKNQLPENAKVLVEDSITDDRGTRFMLVGKFYEKNNI